MRILGIDPGSHATGFGIVDSSGGRLVCVAAGVLPGGKGAAAARLGAISTGLSGLIAQHAPAVVAVERVFVHRNIASALMLGQARGAVLACAGVAGLDVVEYTPTQIKQALVGTGRAGKEQVRHMVGVMLQMSLEGEALDTSDALACAVCHAHSQTLLAQMQGGAAGAKLPARRRTRGRGLRL